MGFPLAFRIPFQKVLQMTYEQSVLAVSISPPSSKLVLIIALPGPTLFKVKFLSDYPNYLVDSRTVIKRMEADSLS